MAPDFISFCHTYAPSSARFAPEPQQHVGRVGRAVDSLHRGDHAQLAEARDIGGAEVLRMLDAPAQVLLVGMRFEGVLEDVERFAIGAVADGVDAQLVPVLDGQLRRLANIGRDRRYSGRCCPACRCTARAATRRASRARRRSARLMARTVK